MSLSNSFWINPAIYSSQTSQMRKINSSHLLPASHAAFNLISHNELRKLNYKNKNSEGHVITCPKEVLLGCINICKTIWIPRQKQLCIQEILLVMNATNTRFFLKALLRGSNTWLLLALIQSAPMLWKLFGAFVNYANIQKDIVHQKIKTEHVGGSQQKRLRKGQDCSKLLARV